jgi:predicted secreted Zn-dependent protease
MNKIRIIAGILVIILSANISHAEIVVSKKYKNYPIRGNNLHEIQKSLVLHGLKDEHGGIFAAKTTPKFTWKYNFVQTANSCSLKSTDVEVEITYQLPKLSGYETLNEADKTEWLRYSAATYKHEQGHANFSIETAKEIESEAKNIPPKSNCGEIARIANMLISEILNHHERDNIAYDTQTAHGVSQGAVFASAE